MERRAQLTKEPGDKSWTFSYYERRPGLARFAHRRRGRLLRAKEDCDGNKRTRGQCDGHPDCRRVESCRRCALWLAGRWLIRVRRAAGDRALASQGFDPTLSSLPAYRPAVVLNVALIVAILGFFGVETTTFAALIAAGGVAIGVAWGGLLANFAAGAFLVFLRPFKVGDFVTAGGVTRHR